DRHFLAGLSGIDLGRTDARAIASEVATSRRDDSGVEEYAAVSAAKPWITGAVRWQRPAGLDELRFLKATATKPIKTTV
ncbi:hypothetical protein ABTM62_20400, partial [Acinetobacter baumannii]